MSAVTLAQPLSVELSGDKYDVNYGGDAASGRDVCFDAGDEPETLHESLQAPVTGTVSATISVMDDQDPFAVFGCCDISGCPHPPQSGGVASLTTFLAQIFPDSALKPVATTRQKSVYCLPADHKMKQFVLTTFQTITFADGVHVISYCTCNPTWRDKASVFECDTSPCTRAASLAALGHACPHARALQVCAGLPGW